MKKKSKILIFLHLMLLMYSCCGVFSKLAAQEEFLSVKFLAYYGAVLLILFVYAILWQKIIKVLPLTTAFANKAAVVIWGIIFGIIFFGETLTVGRIIGALLIVCGIVFYTRSSNLDEVIIHE